MGIIHETGLEDIQDSMEVHGVKMDCDGHARDREERYIWTMRQ